MPKYVSYDEMMEILDNKYLLPFRKDERLRGLNGIDIVRCKDCKHAYYADNRVPQERTWVCERFTNEEINDNDFCSFGERKE